MTSVEILVDEAVTSRELQWRIYTAVVQITRAGSKASKRSIKKVETSEGKHIVTGRAQKIDAVIDEMVLAGNLSTRPGPGGSPVYEPLKAPEEPTGESDSR